MRRARTEGLFGLPWSIFRPCSGHLERKQRRQGIAGLTACSALFSRVLAHVASLSITYGPLSTVIAFMICLWLSTTLVLVGAPRPQLG
ncbi:hypothetical protein MPL3365_140192 [Mesorhizobium plurifarium]|uniref:Uncharacterized protein n=1 Tax=Mesorhizobium plurifarium TaxID=69974 RepID=A0A090FXL7_MESPL|nr:hypothetical protein MPL3365_140192 [Mesorhizobium plurifarium]